MNAKVHTMADKQLAARRYITGNAAVGNRQLTNRNHFAVGNVPAHSSQGEGDSRERL